MGTRINTVLGYGFKYCKGEKDPRFNPWVFGDKEKHPKLGGIWEDIEDLRPLLIKQVKAKIKAIGPRTNNNWGEISDLEMVLFQLKQNNPARPLAAYDFIRTSSNSCEMISHPVVFTDPTQPDWSRHDNIIDYYTVPYEFDDGIKDSVRMLTQSNLPHAIYPWDSYVNRLTGERVKMEGGLILRAAAIEHWVELGCKKRKKFDEFLKGSGVKTMLSYQRDITPFIPGIITEVCELLRVFKNPLTVYRLKPMVYHYWC